MTIEPSVWDGLVTSASALRIAVVSVHDEGWMADLSRVTAGGHGK